MRSQIIVPLIVLFVATQACCCFTILGGPQPPYAITPSDEAVQRFQEQMDSMEPNTDGTFCVTITEEEMTSLVVQGLAEQPEPLPFSQPQVYFRNGRIEIYGTATVADSLTLPGMTAFSIATTPNGIIVTVEEIALGPLPVPASVLQSLSEVINQTLSETIKIEGVEAVITDVQIGAGQMTISGKPQAD